MDTLISFDNLARFKDDLMQDITVDYDFTHIANSTISTSSVDITFDSDKKCTRTITVSNDIELNIAVNNDAENYIWVENVGSGNIDVVFGDISSTKRIISKYILPEDSLVVPFGYAAEIGITVNSDGAYVTYRNDLKKINIIRAKVSVLSENEQMGSASLTNGRNGEFVFASGSTATATMTASPVSGKFFQKWQVSTNGGGSWTDISGATNTTYSATISAAGEFYYRAVFMNGYTVSVGSPRCLEPGWENNQGYVQSTTDIYSGNNSSTTSITVAPNTRVYAASTINNNYCTLNDIATGNLLDGQGNEINYNNYVAMYEISNDNGSSWNTFDGNYGVVISNNSIIRAVQIGQCGVMSVNESYTTTNTPSMSDSASVKIYPTNNTSLSYQALSIVGGYGSGGMMMGTTYYYPIYYGATIDIEYYFEDESMWGGFYEDGYINIMDMLDNNNSFNSVTGSQGSHKISVCWDTTSPHYADENWNSLYMSCYALAGGYDYTEMPPEDPGMEGGEP